MDIEATRKQGSQQAAVLGAGLEQLDLSQEVTFRKYSRVVLPLDGCVFWQPTTTFKVTGSLHHTQQIVQSEDETLGLSTVTFSTQEKIADFTDIPVNSIYVATLGKLRYAFSSHGGYFNAAALWHYQGHSVFPAMASQLLDVPGMLDPGRAIVSNSLPLWLALNSYVSPFIAGFSPGVTLYPSDLVPANLPPPYGAVHIGENDTEALQSVPQIRMIDVQLTAQVVDQDGNPVLGPNGLPIVVPVYGRPGGLVPLIDQFGRDILDNKGRIILVPSVGPDSTPVLVPKRVVSQLKSDKVRITLYGLQNEEAEEFLGAVLEVMKTQPGMGLMSMPTIRDGKRTQVELQALAMQKFIDFRVSYNTFYAKAVAIQLIESASVTLLYS